MRYKDAVLLMRYIKCSASCYEIKFKINFLLFGSIKYTLNSYLIGIYIRGVCLIDQTLLAFLSLHEQVTFIRSLIAILFMSSLSLEIFHLLIDKYYLQCNEIRKMNSNIIVIGKTTVDNDKEDLDNDPDDDDVDNVEESEGDEFEQETG